MSDAKNEQRPDGPPLEWVVERGKVAEFARACLNDSDAHSNADAVE